MPTERDRAAGLVDGRVRRAPARRDCSARTGWRPWSPTSPAIWTDPDDASGRLRGRGGVRASSRSSADQDDLAGIPVRVDCGTGDPFYRAVEDYVAGFPDDADLTSTFEPGGAHAATGAGCCPPSWRSSAAPDRAGVVSGP